MTEQAIHRIYSECLRAAAYGPFFPAKKFSTLFGLEISEARAISDSFDPSTPMQGEVELALNNAMNNLLGYPHDQDATWSDWISVTPEQLESVFRQWRIGRFQA